MNRIANRQLKVLEKCDKTIKEFEFMRKMAELKALGDYSLENQLTDEQFNRIMELKKELLDGEK